MTDRPGMRLLTWRKIGKGKVIGVASIELPNGFRVHEIMVFRGKDGPYAMLPSRPQLNRDRRPVVDQAGKVIYTTLNEWKSAALGKAWSAKLIELCRAAHSDDFYDPETGEFDA
jgi:DNA-binding cell septation regulator SpoVG